MALERKAAPHTYDFTSISCACGGKLGYRPARSGQPVQCDACDAPWTPPAAQPAPLPPAVRELVDAWDHAAARALSGDSSVAIPRALFEAVVEARKELP